MGSFSRAAVAEVTEEMLRRGSAFSPGCALGELGFSYYSHWLAISAKGFRFSILCLWSFQIMGRARAVGGIHRNGQGMDGTDGREKGIDSFYEAFSFFFFLKLR